MRGVDVGVAEAGRLDLHAYLAGLELAARYRFDLQRRAEIVHHRRTVAGQRGASGFWVRAGYGHSGDSWDRVGCVTSSTAAEPAPSAQRGIAAGQTTEPGCAL